MVVLVTGSAGMIGSYVLQRLKDGGVATTGADLSPASDWPGDVSDPSHVDRLLSAIRPSGVVHCAGAMDVTGTRQPADLVYANVVTLTNLCRAVSRGPLVPIVYISSRGVYPWYQAGLVPPLLDEAHPLSVEPTLSIYDATKFMMECVAARYNKQYSMTIRGLRLASTFGLGKTDAKHGHQAVLVRLFHQAAAGATVTVSGIDQHSDFVYLGDVFQAICRAIVASGGSYVYNIGGGARPLRYYLEALQATFPQATYDLGPGPDYLGSGGYGYVNLDYSRANRELGYEPRYTGITAFEEMSRIRAGQPRVWTETFDDLTDELRSVHG